MWCRHACFEVVCGCPALADLGCACIGVVGGCTVRVWTRNAYTQGVCLPGTLLLTGWTTWTDCRSSRPCLMGEGGGAEVMLLSSVMVMSTWACFIVSAMRFGIPSWEHLTFVGLVFAKCATARRSTHRFEVCGPPLAAPILVWFGCWASPSIGA